MDSLKRDDAIIKNHCQAAGNKEALFCALQSVSSTHLKAEHTHTQPPTQEQEERECQQSGCLPNGASERGMRVGKTGLLERDRTVSRNSPETWDLLGKATPSAPQAYNVRLKVF